MSDRPDEVRLRAEDEAARALALDVGRSFIVQAPAGSGKTELLIQRYLALLARVERPERVLAITFTRKAAGEMRDRVVRALEAAQRERRVGLDALEPHERKTRELALDVLAQDGRHGWQLAAHPSRLAIRTIDALAQAIALQAPLASGLPPNPRFTEDAGPHYVEAVRTVIAQAPPGDPIWRELLDHQDNNADGLCAQLAALLAQREQWWELVGGDASGMRERLEATLAREVTGELALAEPVLRGLDAPSLCRVATLAAHHLGDDDAGLREVLAACAKRGGPPPLDPAHLDAWKAIAAWVSKRDGSGLYARATHLAGIPRIQAKTEGEHARRADADAVTAWLASLAATPGLEAALASIRRLPPTRYTDDEWSRIASVLSLLPDLQSSLERVFAQAGEMDFAQATLAALRALGDGDAPTELLLRLDLAVDHVLVDEFQDTSFTHLDLLRRLCSGWSDGDGRTIFAVGDPMQSIYRFRGAEVRAFVDAQSAGAIEGIAVEPLTLRRNFRSQAGLVAWANTTFPDVLGGTNDAWAGRVAFAGAVAARDAIDAEPCTVDVAADAADEAHRVVAHVRHALEAGRTVAILVRARSHLVEILPTLRASGIAYAAVELDALADRSAVRDFVALAHALVQPDDRLAWLATLRAPWCGLPLDDLHAIVRAADVANRPVEAFVRDPPPSLSEDGRARVARVAAALAVVDGSRATLAERVAEVWRALGGPATLDDPLDLVAVDDTIALIAAHERAGDVDDWNALAARLEGELLSPSGGTDARVQVMTMHKAKGLEFDAVVLPGLAHARHPSSAPFLRWRTRRHGLLLDLAKPRGGEHDGVYAYLKALADEEERVELGRVAYVACTRAKHRLALVAVIERRADRKTGEIRWVEPKPPALYGVLRAPGFGALSAPDAASDSRHAVIAPPALARLPSSWRAPAPIVPLVAPAPLRAIDETPPFDWARERARRLGVVVHLVLAQIASEGLVRWDDERLALQAPHLEALLIGEGALPSVAAQEGADVRATLATMLRDPRGRWLLDPTHADARSEWALTGVDAGETVHVVLDRAFVADGVRWIVDFKTGMHEGSDPGAFLEAEAGRYRAQLERYARIVRSLDPDRPIRVALYHPRVPGGWREFAA